MNDLEQRIRRAMLAWLLDHPEEWDWDTPPDVREPVEVTGWEQTPFMEESCPTCGPEWPTVTIHYVARDGTATTVTIIEDFGDFITELCGKDTP